MAALGLPSKRGPEPFVQTNIRQWMGAPSGDQNRADPIVLDQEA